MAVHITQTRIPRALRQRANCTTFIHLVGEIDYTDEVVRTTVLGDHVSGGRPDQWSLATVRLSVEDRGMSSASMSMDANRSGFIGQSVNHQSTRRVPVYPLRGGVRL